MTLFNYTPFLNESGDISNGMRVFQDSVNRLLSDPGVRPWSPAVDIVESEDDLVLKADVPGVDMKDIDIRMENGTLTIKGERKLEQQGKANGFHRLERAYGSFARSFSLPESVDPERIKADYRNGVLTVTMPKKEVAKPRSIKVEVNS